MRATVWPAGAGLEIGERQAEQMMEQPPAQFDIDAIGRVAQRIGAQELQDRTRTSPSVTMPTISTTSVDMPLCTSTLSTTSWKKIGVDQSEQLHEQRSDEHLGERLAIAKIDGRNQRKPKVLGSTPPREIAA